MAEGGQDPRAAFARSPSIIRSLSREDQQAEHTISDHGKLLVRGLEKIHLTDRFLDVTVVAGGHRIRAHKIILAAFSPVFEKLLCSDMKEASLDEITLHGAYGQPLEGQIVEKLINFAYTGRIAYNGEDVQDLLVTANYLDIKLVCQECVRFIINRIDSQNCMDVYNLGLHLGEKLMFTSAMSYFSENFSMMTKTEEFRTMPIELLIRVLNEEKLQYIDPKLPPLPAHQEAGILHTVLTFVGHNKKSLLHRLQELLLCVRLPLLLTDALKKLQEHPLVKEGTGCVEVVQKARSVQTEYNVKATCDPWAKVRDNNVLSVHLSGAFASGGQIRPILSSYDDCQQIPQAVHLSGMKIWIRRWDGRPVWGGYEERFSNGMTIHHGGQDFGHEVHEFTLEEGEVIQSLVINSGFLIDRVTFHTSNSRRLGPYGGAGGGMQTVNNGTKDNTCGFLCCTKGRVAQSQGSMAICNLRFVWSSHVCEKKSLKLPVPQVCHSDLDSGEELTNQASDLDSLDSSDHDPTDYDEEMDLV